MKVKNKSDYKRKLSRLLDRYYDYGPEYQARMVLDVFFMEDRKYEEKETKQSRLSA